MTRVLQIIGVDLALDGWRLAGGDEAIDALVIDRAAPVAGVRFDAVTDAMLRAGLDGFTGLILDLQAGLSRLRDGGSIVVVTTRGYLGAWGGVHDMAFAAATVALLRSVTLETAARGIRANVLAVDFPVGEAGPEIARGVRMLLSDDARDVNGEVILLNGGRSLRLREGQDRRANYGSEE